MTLKAIIPVAFVCALMTGEANAQSVGAADNDQTGAPISLAPGNPNTTTIVSPEVPSTPMMDDSSASSNTTSSDRSDINIIMPSAGGSGNTPAIYETAPSNMDYDQFRSYLDKQWGVNGNAQVTASQWNAIDPAYFGGHKPSFDTLPPSYGASGDNRDLQSVYSSLYERYEQYSNH